MTDDPHYIQHIEPGVDADHAPTEYACSGRCAGRRAIQLGRVLDAAHRHDEDEHFAPAVDPKGPHGVSTEFGSYIGRLGRTEYEKHARGKRCVGCQQEL